MLTNYHTEIENALEILKKYKLNLVDCYANIVSFDRCHLTQMYRDEMSNLVSKEDLEENIKGIKEHRIPLVQTNISDLLSSEDYSEAYKSRNIDRYLKELKDLKDLINKLSNSDPVDVLFFDGYSTTFNELQNSEAECDHVCDCD